jgi:hypothetical protein
LAFLPIAVVVSVGFGYLGVLIGKKLSVVLMVPDLASRVAFLLGSDGLGIVCLVYWKTMATPRADNILTASSTFLLYFAVGVKCGSGLGVAATVLWGAINSLLGLGGLAAIQRFGQSATSAKDRDSQS